MSQKNVLHTQGIRFQRDSGTSWDDIGQCKDISPAGGSRTTIDTTTIDQYDGSEPDINKQYVGGLVEYDSFELDMIIDPASTAQRTLEGDLYAPNPIRYRVLYTNGWTREFFGIVTSIKPTNAMDDVSRQTVSIKVSGKSVLTEAV
jgi:hypothetical protein